MCRVILQGKAPRKIGADLLPQFHGSRIGCVVGLSLLQALDTRLADVPRGDKIRLAYRQRGDIGHAVQKDKKLTDTGGRHSGNAARDDPLIVDCYSRHQSRFPLSSISGAP